MKNNLYKIVYSNQSFDTSSTFELIRESKMYYFFKRVSGFNDDWVYRVHKNTYNTKIITSGWANPSVKAIAIVKL